MDILSQHSKLYISSTDPMHAVQQSAPLPGTSRSVTLKVKLRRRTPSSRGSSQVSSDDRPLFMAMRKAWKDEELSSPIISGASKAFDRQPESIIYPSGDCLGENTAYEIIEREISEWQNVCKTGRPGWWSPVSYWDRAGIYKSTWKRGTYNIPSWQLMQGVRQCSDPAFVHIRRAVTDSYLADNNHVHELAQLIAVQLLGACFTLPRDYLSADKSTGLWSHDPSSLAESSDSPLISSLRMHTESRYTPAFGHQARNTSPATIWSGAFDGTSPAASPDATLESSPQIESSEKRWRKRKSAQPLNVSEVSDEDSQSKESSEQCQGNGQSLQISPLPKGRNKLGKLILPKRDALLLFRDWNACPAAGFSRSIQPRCPDNSVALARSEDQMQGIHRPEPPTSVLAQPVTGMIAKRWQLIRRRFGHSLSHGYPEPATIPPELIISESNPQFLTRKRSIEDESRGNSSDGKERRRRARERGYIHSSSMESNPRYNTPTGLSPMSPARLGPTTRYQYADPLTAAVKSIGTFQSRMNTNFRKRSSISSSGANSPHFIPGTKHKEQSKIKEAPTTKQNPRPLSPSRGIEPKNVPRGQSRNRHRGHRSQLSEVYNSDYFEERSLLSALGSAMSSPNAPEAEFEPRVSSSRDRDRLDASQLEELHRTGIMPLEEASGPNEGVYVRKRPRISRVSTSGTQLFTPAEDGVEVDGLPVGPTSDIWDAEDKGNGRRIRSFL